ncbi:MAG: hypothetical protein RBT64_02960 [Trichloromonas sp.]|jgi:hypothetical protein|nr:hypothetical protein [Trichloromonas sp.]
MSPFFDVRFEAACSLVAKGDERALRPLLQGMRAGDSATREKARAGFLKLATALVGPSIVDVLRFDTQSMVKGLLSRLAFGGHKGSEGKKAPDEESA